MSIRDNGRARPQIPPQTPLEPSTDPAVINHLEYVSGLERERNELREALEVERNTGRANLDRAVSEIKIARERSVWLEKEHARVRVERDAYQRAYEALRAEISVVASTATGALDKAKGEMLRVNIDVDQPADPAAAGLLRDEQLTALAKNFGFSNREPEGTP